MRESQQGNSRTTISAICSTPTWCSDWTPRDAGTRNGSRPALARVNAVPVEAEPDPEVVIGTIALLIPEYMTLAGHLGQKGDGVSFRPHPHDPGQKGGRS